MFTKDFSYMYDLRLLLSCIYLVTISFYVAQAIITFTGSE